jgi:hypothetical protein
LVIERHPCCIEQCRITVLERVDWRAVFVAEDEIILGGFSVKQRGVSKIPSSTQTTARQAHHSAQQ